eukprot:SAG22_NODE_18094_length_293_cov_1.067010_1_plen_51_part_10
MDAEHRYSAFVKPFVGHGSRMSVVRLPLLLALTLGGGANCEPSHRSASLRR